MNPMTLGRYLRDLRVGRGLTLEQVAGRSRRLQLTSSGGISRSQLQHVESGKTKHPALPKLVTLSRLYDVPLSNLTAFFDSPVATWNDIDSEGGISLRDAKDSLTADIRDEKDPVLRAIRMEIKKKISKAEASSGGHTSSRRSEELIRNLFRLLLLEEDAEDSRAGRDRALLPACDGAPPISINQARRQLYGLFPDKPDEANRRSMFRMLLRLHGEALQTISRAFWAAYIKLPSIQEEIRRIGLKGLEAMVREKAGEGLSLAKSREVVGARIGKASIRKRTSRGVNR